MTERKALKLTDYVRPAKVSEIDYSIYGSMRNPTPSALLAIIGAAEMTEREAFENWLKESGSFADWSRDRTGDGPYHKPLVERAWQAWQAAVRWARESKAK